MIFSRVLSISTAMFFLVGLALGSEGIPNWPAPTTWSPSRGSGVRTLTDVSHPLPFIGVTPCRLVDTRGTPGVPINTGGAFSANEIRTWVFAGLCGIPVAAKAVSLNVTVTNTQPNPFGFVKIWPGGGTQPNVSTLNWSTGGVTVANAAIVPLGTSPAGSVSLQSGNAGCDVIVDVNGYYSPTGAAPTEFQVDYPIISDISSGTVAIEGLDLMTGVATWGVAGIINSQSFDSAGVFGNDSSTAALDSYNPAGVRGESDGNGVLGISTFQAVAGSAINSAGHETAYGILGYTFGTATYGVFSGGNTGASGTKSFVEPHPSDASKVIRYVSLEGPEAGTYFRGRGKFQNGLATIDVPEDFRMVTDSEGLSIQVTPIGELATVAVVRIDLDEILVRSSRNVEFFYTVNGVRKTQRDFQPIGPGSEYMPRSADARMPLYLTEGQKALLVSNGTYNADGTVNMETAERLGWTKMWAEREVGAKAPSLRGQPNAPR